MNLGGRGMNSASMQCSTESRMCAGVGDVLADQFPAGLRVLVVDDDPTSLIILEKMLRKCFYEVTKCNRAEEALSKLRARKKGYDIVIIDVHMPGMDGFTLLELIGLEMDLPVIMMSADDGKNVVMKGVIYGACDYLVKPVRMEALKNVWQHVVRKNKNEWRVFYHSRSADDGDRGAVRLTEEADFSSSANEGNWRSSKKRSSEEDVVEDRDDTSTLKKPRVVWSAELHHQFVAAVNHLGIAKAVPKKILELMNVPSLTRENVASHLQKYRLFLRRLNGESQHQGGTSNPFMGHPEGFRQLVSFNGIDFHALPTNGQISAQSLATMQAAALGRSITAQPGISIPIPLTDQRNLFSFDTSRLRYADPGLQQQQQPQLNSNVNNTQMNLLHGIPTSVEPNQLASFQQSAQNFRTMNNPLLGQMRQMSRPLMINEANGTNQVLSQISGSVPTQGLLTRPLMINEANGTNQVLSQISGSVPTQGLLTRPNATYNTVVIPQTTNSVVDFSTPQNHDISSVNAFSHGNNNGNLGMNSKGVLQEDISSDVNRSRGFSSNCNILTELHPQQQEKPQDWAIQTAGVLTFHSSRQDIPSSSFVNQQGFTYPQNGKWEMGNGSTNGASTSKNTTASTSKMNFSMGNGSTNGASSSSAITQQLNHSPDPNNLLRPKIENFPDLTSQTSFFPDQNPQEDIVVTILRQQGVDLMANEFEFDGYTSDNLPD